MPDYCSIVITIHLFIFSNYVHFLFVLPFSFLLHSLAFAFYLVILNAIPLFLVSLLHILLTVLIATHCRSISTNNYSIITNVPSIIINIPSIVIIVVFIVISICPIRVNVLIMNIVYIARLAR